MGPHSNLTCVYSLLHAKCWNAAREQVEVECAARVPSTSGRQGAGEPYWVTPAGQPLRFTVGDSPVSFPPGDCAHHGTLHLNTPGIHYGELQAATGWRLQFWTRARCCLWLDELCVRGRV